MTVCKGYMKQLTSKPKIKGLHVLAVIQTHVNIDVHALLMDHSCHYCSRCSGRLEGARERLDIICCSRRQSLQHTAARWKRTQVRNLCIVIQIDRWNVLLSPWVVVAQVFVNVKSNLIVTDVSYGTQDDQGDPNELSVIALAHHFYCHH